MSRKTFSYVFTRICVLAAGIFVLCAPSVYAAAELYIGAGGTIEMSAGEIILTGDFNNAGTFTQTGGTVTFEGSGVSALTGNTTFANLKCDVTSAKTITFTGGSTQIVQSSCTMNGRENNILTLQSSSESPWYLQLTNVSTFNYVSVSKGSAPVAGSVVICNNSTNGGGNYRFLFGAAGAPTWFSPKVYVGMSLPAGTTGYTLNSRPIFSFYAPSRDIAFTNAEIVFSTVTSFSGEGVTVITRTYSDYKTAWAGWTSDALQPTYYSTYTVRTDDALTVGSTYYVRVRLYDSYFWTDWAANTRKVLVLSTTTLTDPTITEGVTPIRAVHFTELKTHIANVSYFRTLSTGTWTTWDAYPITAGSTPIKAGHIQDVRTNLEPPLSATGQPHTWQDDPTITAGATPIRKKHIDELRTQCAKP